MVPHVLGYRGRLRDGGGAMTDPEPTYIYIKGQGWVPRVEGVRYSVMYRSLPHHQNWVNANFEGSYYTTLEAAERRVTQGRNLYMINEYKIITDEVASEYHVASDDKYHLRLSKR